MKRIWFLRVATIVAVFSLIPINFVVANGVTYTYHQIDMTAVYNSKAFDANMNYTTGSGQKYWVNPGTVYSDSEYGNVPMDIRPAGQYDVWLSRGYGRTATFTNSITLSMSVPNAVAVWLVGLDGGWVYNGSPLQVSYKLDKGDGNGVQQYQITYNPNDWYTAGTDPGLSLWVDSRAYPRSPTNTPVGDIAVARIDLPQAGTLSEIKINDADTLSSYADSFPIFAITVAEELHVVDVDIKPMSYPNPFNVRAKGVLPVAIMGTSTFDVNQIDPASVKIEGVAPLRWALEDVGTAGDPLAGPDGYLDLTFKFDAQSITDALGTVSDRDIVTLRLTGMGIVGDDEVLIIKK